MGQFFLQLNALKGVERSSKGDYNEKNIDKKVGRKLWARLTRSQINR